MIGRISRRGQPLIVFALLLSGWVSARAMMWESSPVSELPEPFSPQAELHFKRLDLALNFIAKIVSQPYDQQSKTRKGLTDSVTGAVPAPQAEQDNDPAFVKPTDGNNGYMGLLPPPPGQIVLPPQAPVQLPPAAPKISYGQQVHHLAGGHAMLLMSAMAQLGNSLELLHLQPANGLTDPNYSKGKPIDKDSPPAKRSKWSSDSWLLWRRDGGSQLAGGLLPPSYGASQAGAVLRYRLNSDSSHKPALYFRSTSSLNGSGEQEAALGLSLRPAAHIPLLAAGEARVSQGPGGRMIRPAAFVITELPPLRLPHGLRGEIYGQAGYVGGAFATGFVDGQMRVDKHLMTFEKADVRLGSGIWGGAQKGASRLDAGPTLSVSRPLRGSSSVRLGADWRFRLAGKAAPGSGPAVTLSAGF